MATAVELPTPCSGSKDRWIRSDPLGRIHRCEPGRLQLLAVLRASSILREDAVGDDAPDTSPATNAPAEFMAVRFDRKAPKTLCRVRSGRVRHPPYRPQRMLSRYPRLHVKRTRTTPRSSDPHPASTPRDSPTYRPTETRENDNSSNLPHDFFSSLLKLVQGFVENREYGVALEWLSTAFSKRASPLGSRSCSPIAS